MRQPTHRAATWLLVAFAALVAGVAFGCGSAPTASRAPAPHAEPQAKASAQLASSPPASTSGAPAAPSVPPADPARASVVLRNLPRAASLDGDLSEWGALEPPAPIPKPVPPEEPAATAPVYPPIRAELSDAENPLDAPSRVALAVSQTGLSIAAQLGEGRGDEVWIGIADRPPEPLPMGRYQRGGYTRPMQCERVDLGMFEGEVSYGAPNPPEVVAACEALKTRYAKFTTQYEKRFSKRIKLTPNGAAQLAEDGTLTPIEGARIVAKQGPSGTRLEALLPLTVMPRLTQAPLLRLRVAARTSATLPADIAAEPWLWAALPEAVHFEPHAALRERMFALTGHRLNSPGINFHPSDPLHLETLDYTNSDQNDRSVVGAVVRALYEPKKVFGELEIGVARAAAPALVVHRKGTLLHVLPDLEDAGMVNDETGNRIFVGTILRGTELHLISFLPAQNSAWAGPLQAHFSIVRVSTDGALLPPPAGEPLPPDMNEVLLEEELKRRAPGAPEYLGPNLYDLIEQTSRKPHQAWFRGPSTLEATRDLSSFGFRGDYLLAPADQKSERVFAGLAVSFRWDAVKKTYVCSQRQTKPVGRNPDAARE